MIKIILFVIAMTFLSCERNSPKILSGLVFLEKEMIDLGKIKNDEKQNIAVGIVNDTGENLKVLGAKSVCGCTTVGDDKFEIEPGNKGYLKISYDPKDDKGSVGRKVMIRTSDGSFLLFKFIAEVI